MQKYDENFEKEFWKPYPRKVGKPAASRAYIRILRVEPTLGPVIRAAIVRHQRTAQWQNPLLVPHPATFLNQRRFDDEVIEDTKTVTAKSEWDLIMETVKRVGSYQKFDIKWSEKAQKALVAIGGYYEVCRSTEFSNKRMAKKFVEIYRIL